MGKDHQTTPLFSIPRLFPTEFLLLSLQWLLSYHFVQLLILNTDYSLGCSCLKNRTRVIPLSTNHRTTTAAAAAEGETLNVIHIPTVIAINHRVWDIFGRSPFNEPELH